PAGYSPGPGVRSGTPPDWPEEFAHGGGANTTTVDWRSLRARRRAARTSSRRRSYTRRDYARCPRALGERAGSGGPLVAWPGYPEDSSWGRCTPECRLP